MTDSTAYLKIYNAKEHPGLLNVNLKEVRRYAGLINADGAKEVNEMLDELLEKEIIDFSYKVSFRRFDISFDGDIPVLPFAYGKNGSLARNLKGCSEVILMAATVGIDIDRKIAKYNRVSPVKALFLQAYGAERIESLVNFFNEEIRQQLLKEGKFAHPRFSPGYGDLDISVQKDFVELLDCSRRLGINLNESMLMSPSKSITAIIGISDSEDGACMESGCKACGKKDCEYRND